MAQFWRSAATWPGAVELEVTHRRTANSAVRWPTRILVGSPRVGRPCAAEQRRLTLAGGLGTGGYALVVALPDRLPPDADPARDTS